MTTLSHTARNLSPDGDYIWLCAACAHAVAGYDGEDVFGEPWSTAVAEGARELEARMIVNGYELYELKESTDSNLLNACDVCGAEHTWGEFYEGYAARVSTTPHTDEEIGNARFYVPVSPIEEALRTAERIIAADGGTPKPTVRLRAIATATNGEDIEWSLVGTYPSDAANTMIWQMLGRKSFAPNGELLTVHTIIERDSADTKTIARWTWSNNG